MTSGNKATKAAIIIILLSFGSKILGFFREVLIASKFGAGFKTDAYIVALTAIGLVTGLVGVTLTTATIPLLTKIEANDGKNAKIRCTNNIVNFILLVSFGIYIISLFMAPYIVKLVAKNYVNEQLAFTIKLTRIGLPIVIVTGLSSVITGYLHTEQRFISSAFGGFSYNIILIIFLLLFSKKYGIEGLLFINIIAFISRIIIQFPDLKKSKYKYDSLIDFKDKYLHKFIGLTMPIYLGTVMDEVNLILDKTFASGLKVGSISALNYATKLNGLVLGVFISAVSTVIFPMLSKGFSNDNYDEVKRIMSYGINLILLITIPTANGLIVLSEPIVAIAFQRGKFDAIATFMTSKALIFYSLGLIAMGANSILTKVFYSLQDTKTPTFSVAVSLSINIILNIILVKLMGHSGLALATSVATTGATLFMIYNLKKKIGSLGTKQYIITFFKTGLASTVMGFVAYLTYHGLYKFLGISKLYNFISLAMAAGLAIIIYGVLCYLLKVEVARDLVDKVKIRLKE